MTADIISLLDTYQRELILASRVLFILFLTYLTAKVSDLFLDQRFKQITKQMDVSKTSTALLKRLARAGIWIIGFAVAIYTVPSLRQLSMALFASAGFLGIVVGFAAKEAVGNIIAGIFIVLFDPFRVGDNIKTQSHYGTVEDITLRQTVVNTPSNERVIIPNNSILNDYIINYSIVDETSRYAVEFGVAYREDIDEARQIILEEADKHELTGIEESQVIVKNLADSAVILELRVWAQDRGDAWTAGTDIRESVKKRFDEEGITIPFPHRTISHPDTDGERGP